MLLNSNIIFDELVLHNLAQKDHKNLISYTTQILQLLDKLNELLNSSANAKVIMPVQPTFILELVDLLLHKLSDRVRIVVISYSANSVV